MSTDDLCLMSLFELPVSTHMIEIGKLKLSFLSSNASSTDFDKTGFVLWRASRLMVYFLQLNETIVANKNVLELGSGCSALGGVTAMLLGAKKIICTDGDLESVNICSKTLALNDYTKEMSGFGEQHCWGDFDGLKKIFTKHDIEKTDLVLGCDVCVWEESLLGLFQSAYFSLYSSLPPSASDARVSVSPFSSLSESSNTASSSISPDFAPSSSSLSLFSSPSHPSHPSSFTINSTYPFLPVCTQVHGILSPHLCALPLFVVAFERRALRPEKKMEDIYTSFGLKRLRISALEFITEDIMRDVFGNGEFFVDVFFRNT